MIHVWDWENSGSDLKKYIRMKRLQIQKVINKFDLKFDEF